MSVGDIFRYSHSNSLITSKLKSTGTLNMLKEEGYDADKFFHIEGNLFPYAYINGTVLVEVYSLDKEDLEVLHVKEIIKQREEKHKKCVENKDYSTLFNLIDKPYRFNWFVELFNDIPDEDKWSIFKDIYSSSEYGFSILTKEFMLNLLKYRDEEICNSDEEVVVYRGEGLLSTPYTEAYSWTTSLEVAKFFANRFNNQGKVLRGKVKCKDIITHINSRSEYEVLLFSDSLYNVEIIE